MPSNCEEGRRKEEVARKERRVKEERNEKRKSERRRPECEGRSKNTEREVHNLTHSKMQNLLRELQQQTDKKLLIDFCASAK